MALGLLGILLVLWFLPSPVEAEESDEYSVDAAGGLNVRSSPDIQSTIIGSLSDGSTINVQEQENGWSKINYNGVTAWVSSDFLNSSGSSPLDGINITLDPGHGGYDPGAISVDGTYEKDLNLRTAQHTYEKLKEAGAVVTMTRSGDQYLSLEERVEHSHSTNADAFISIHYNSSITSSANGISSYYYNDSKDLPFAQELQGELSEQTTPQNNGEYHGDFHVMRENNSPAALLELGFLSNPEETVLVQTDSYQSQVSSAIVDGIINYFE
ncbi:N-acetylmuramoyl-L-alanine amidase [Halobacillus sp. A1]|uniref:N-acetylmuramoyl-L-alanine amidase n=1 Tax=Halobacillus sp. A1 TaxID=2880262 RepID=UPI0020A6CAF4|nr:N-acetylmuramoyl-L-alanine amidase [Halobacillus sp. A1]MCP3029953.1 N-acetylmuramoyl-L-alanine amidase [Halobacillus sp. A1]